MNRFRISTKLALASAASMAALILCGWMAYQGLHQQRSAIDGIIGRFAGYEASSSVRADLTEVHTSAYRLITWSVAKYDQAKIDAIQKGALETLDRTRAAIASRLAEGRLTEEERTAYQSIGEAVKEYQGTIATVMDLATGDLATSTMYMTNADERFQKLSGLLAGLDALEKRLSTEQNERSLRAFERVLSWLLAVVLAAGVLLAGVSLLLSRSIGGVVRALLHEADRLTEAVAEGKLDVRCEADRVGTDFRPVVESMNGTMDAFVKPMSMAAEHVARISRGDVPDAITVDLRGDFNTLKDNLNQCSAAVKALVADAGLLASAAVEGQLATRADATRHRGDFRRIIQGVNDTLDAVIGPLGVAARCVDDIAKGKIPPRITEDYRGEFNVIKQNLNQCIDAVNALVSDVNTLATAGVEGRLATRADPARHQGDFRRIVEGMNATLDGVVAPIKASADYLDRISRGEVPARIEARFNGDFDAIKESLNRCIAAVNLLVADTDGLVKAAVAGQLATRADAARHQGDFRRIVEGVNRTLDALLAPVDEAAGTMDRLAHRDLRARMSGTYQGGHARLKDAVNGTAESLQGAMAQVAEAAEQVSQSASQIASSSQAVASGASEQASSIAETSSSLDSMAALTRSAAESAQQANALALAAQGAAGEGNAAMGQMQGAMERIRASAEGTAQIIRDINEIAFQTNLLALNAAVEAARAGEAGRGFAVVAEEVRSLALRSKDAAMKTEELIRQSVREAEGGTVTSKQVNDRLAEIVDAVGKVSTIVADITRSARAQSTGIEQVNAAVAEMDKVTQQNAASSEESSSAAAELSSQSEELAAMVATFQIDVARRPSVGGGTLRLPAIGKAVPADHDEPMLPPPAEQSGGAPEREAW